MPGRIKDTMVLAVFLVRMEDDALRIQHIFDAADAVVQDIFRRRMLIEDGRRFPELFQRFRRNCHTPNIEAVTEPLAEPLGHGKHRFILTRPAPKHRAVQFLGIDDRKSEFLCIAIEDIRRCNSRLDGFGDIPFVVHQDGCLCLSGTMRMKHHRSQGNREAEEHPA